MAYLDNSGLYRKYGTERTEPNVVGEYKAYGDVSLIEMTLTLADATETETIISDVGIMPKGSLIQSVEIVTQTAAATGTAIDLGLIRTDRTTVYDYDGLLAAFPTTSMDAAGEIFLLNEAAASTYNGALVGTTLANNGLFTWSRTDATAFTAGVIRVRIRYFVPA